MPNDASMNTKHLWVLITYLAAIAVVMSYLIVSLWSAQPPVASNRVPAPDCRGEQTPQLTNVDPYQMSVGVAGDVVLIGCSLPASPMVKLNGVEHPASSDGSTHIRVGLTAADVAIPSTLIFTVSNATGTVIGNGTLRVVPVIPPMVLWAVFGASWPIGPEVRLLLMAFVMGAFGASIHAMKSVVDYRGEQLLVQSWLAFYIVQPLQGMGIALILYMVVRGGFPGVAAGDVASSSLFSICALAGLAGTFSDIAFLKLREVFQTLFKPNDTRSDKMGFKITTDALPNGKVGRLYDQLLAVTGGVAPFKWTVAPALPASLSLGEAGAIKGTPDAQSPKSPYHFTVTDSSSPKLSAMATLTLEIEP